MDKRDSGLRGSRFIGEQASNRVENENYEKVQVDDQKFNKDVLLDFFMVYFGKLVNYESHGKVARNLQTIPTSTKIIERKDRPSNWSKKERLTKATITNISLARSNLGELLILTDAQGKHAGRSYDGGDWEPVHPLLQIFTCNDTLCTTSSPPKNYAVKSQVAPTRSNAEKVSRLLIQTTFGPNQTLINQVGGMTAADWLFAQMGTPATLFRVHLRERENQRLRQGAVLFGSRDPCLPGSRWNRFAFSKVDRGKSINITDSGSVGQYILSIDGVARTEVAYLPSIPSNHRICEVAEYVGGNITVGLVDAMGLIDCAKNISALPNPAIVLTGTRAPSTQGTMLALSPPVLDVALLNSVTSACNLPPTIPIFMTDVSTGNVYMGDRRLESINNNIGSRSVKRNSRTKTCPRAPKTFLNQNTCYITAGCSPPIYSSAPVLLNDSNIREFYLKGGLFVYRIGGLKLNDTDRPVVSPCSRDKEFHRWIRRDPSSENSDGSCSSETPDLNSTIKTLLAQAIANASITSSGGRVIDVRNLNGGNYTCTDTANLFRGATITVPGKGCFTHSHYDEWSVFDFSPWIMLHPGNEIAYQARKPHPIAKHAETGQVTFLDFPSWKTMDKWEDNKSRFPKLGNYLDTVNYATLNLEVQGPATANFFGAIEIGESDTMFEVCGSPGEVSNDPIKGHQYLNFQYGDQGTVQRDTLDQDHDISMANEILWATIVFNAPDQLRQRVAWALSEILVVTENDIDRKNYAENWANYYDIFVRHSFGNFRDILKEVSTSPMMGVMLTILGSKSYASNVEQGSKLFPDENFAREIMQLFTIGLWKLNLNGTRSLDSNGSPRSTYDNRDITELSRGWTGLDREDWRQNYEAYNLDKGAANDFDPMKIFTKDTRDVFPKLFLEDGGVRKYIGDGIPRCDLMPPQAFLKKGATYRYLGTTGSPQLVRADPSSWDVNDAARKLLLAESSAFYGKLCNPDANGKCQFQSYVVLDQNLDCSGNCSSSQSGRATGSYCECSIDEPRVVRLDGSKTGSQKPIYYEYVRAPCVRLGFPEPGNSVTVKQNAKGGEAMCAQANLPEAGAACCSLAANNTPIATNAIGDCVFQGERVTFSTAQKRCSANKKTLCTWINASSNNNCGTGIAGSSAGNLVAGMNFTWTNSPCTVKAQINIDGQVAIIHDVAPLTNPVKKRVAVGTGTYFQALWENGFPLASAGCGTGCTIEASSTCLCIATVSTVAAFTVLPSRNEILSKLNIGAPDPSSFAGTYTGVNSSDYVIHYKSAGVLDKDTIFELVVNGQVKFLMNMKSSVEVGGKVFRNPPMLNSAIDQTRRDGYYELDVMLDYYAQHSNVAPFIARSLIQKLTTSNPSPNYVQAVADAFRTGYYAASGSIFGSGSFGSGKYGSMAATVAAIFLHREARSEVLEADPNHGSVREPLLKLMHFYRAMELSTSDQRERELRMRTLRQRTGQEPFNQPSVFSFFLPDNKPAGPVYDADLVSPESQVLDAPLIIGSINAYASLAKYGLNDCEGGIGFSDSYERYKVRDHPEGGSFSCTLAGDSVPTVDVPFRLRWKPSAWNSTAALPGPSTNPEAFRSVAQAVVKEMDLLLTSGRLDASSLEVIAQGYMAAAAKMKTKEQAHIEGLRHAQQIFAFTPEFHITNNLRDSAASANPQVRPQDPVTLPPQPPPVTNYKAIIYLWLGGGSDTYNAVIPYTCASNLATQYSTVRGDLAVSADSVVQIPETTGNQPCSMFGLHPSLSTVAQLYKSGDAAVMANIGSLVERLDKYQYQANSRLVPQSLFAHNVQTDAAQTVAGLNSTANGVLGRLGDALNAQNCELYPGKYCDVFDGYSISGTPTVLEGAPGVSRVADVLTSAGLTALAATFTPIKGPILNLTKNISTSIFGETYSAATVNAFSRMDLLGQILNSNTSNPNQACWDISKSNLKEQFRTVARVILKRDALAAKRDVFYVSQGGYDTHSDVGGTRVTNLFAELDDAINCFTKEMKSRGLWQNVTIVTASEFGRTLTSNGQGSDHGWGGNHFAMGGAINGGRFFGQFPSDLTDASNINVGRGRLIPTTSWDSLWNGLAIWFGLNQARIAQVLPNLGNFPNDNIGANLLNDLAKTAVMLLSP